jgi:hypothetical protein
LESYPDAPVADLGDVRLALAALVLLGCGVAFAMHERESALDARRATATA